MRTEAEISARLKEMPSPDQEVLPGIICGHPGQPFTPAFWMFEYATENWPRRKGFGETLAEETAACLLGGHGVRGEVGVAAFRHLKSHGGLSGLCSAAELEKLLRQPLDVGGRKIKYRYPVRKADHIASALSTLRTQDVTGLRGRALRDALTALKGVGLKTASWIVRNWECGDDVAILDIHVHRAGVLMGLYDPDDNIASKYRDMERSYLDLAAALCLPAGRWDHKIWGSMRICPILVRDMLVERGVRPEHRCGLPPKSS